MDKLSGAGANVTPPTDTAEPAAADERVRVKSPTGEVGSIPASQLDDAIKAGYQQLK